MPVDVTTSECIESAYAHAAPRLRKQISQTGFLRVWKVAGKVFALADIDAFDGVTLKCDPEYAVELREQHTGIIGGYHANKKHWNTVRSEADVPRALVLDLIDHSYERVVAGFSQKQRKALGLQGH